jgi:predicted extracellular nuclease
MMLSIILVPTSCKIHSGTIRDDLPRCPPAGSEGNKRIRIVFYNTENCFDTVDDSLTADEDFLPDGRMQWNLTRYKTKLEKISKVLIAAGEWEAPDIIGLAEIENSRVLNDLVSHTALLKYEYRYVHKNSPDSRGIDVALLVNPSTVKILETGFIPVSTGYSERPTRDILYARLSVSPEEIIHVFVNHWPSRSGGILETEPLRLCTAGILRKKIDSVFHADFRQKVIVMGDFNDSPFDKSLILGLQVETNVNSPSPGTLYNLCAGYEQKNKVGSHKFQGQWNMLDQIIVSGALLKPDKGIRTSPDCFSVFAAPFLLTEDKKYAGMEPFRTYRGPVYLGGFSDHLPVMLDLF